MEVKIHTIFRVASLMIKVWRTTLLQAFFAACFFITNRADAQVNIAGMGINYSALVRDTLGKVQPLKSLQLRFTVLVGNTGTTATSPWIETQQIITDAFGFANVIFGNGIKAGGTATSFPMVDFSQANYWLLTEIFDTPSQSWKVLSKQALQAVPYAKTALYATVQRAVPPGTIMAFGGDTSHIPAGWLLCNGRQLDMTNQLYLPLFQAIGYSWGSSVNNPTIFAVPYTQGVFLRGANNGKGADPDDAARYSYTGGNAGDKIGSFQLDALQNHLHKTTSEYTPLTTSGGLFLHPTDSPGFVPSLPFNLFDTTTGIISGLNPAAFPRVASESRPVNVYVNFIIKL